MKRFVSVILALAMVFALGINAYAAETEKAAAQTFTITINGDKPGHTFEAYQIFAATLFVNAEGQKVLSDIKWGSGVTADGQTALGNAVDNAKSLKDDKTAREFANKVAQYLDSTNAKASTFANGKYTISGLEAGYYLVKDKNNTVPEGDAYTSYILEVVGNVDVKPKSGVPQVVKKVQDTNDSTGVTTGWQDSADYDIGDKVPFQLTATLAGNVSSYNTYKIVFHDKLSPGLTFDNNAKIMFGGQDVKSHFDVQYNEQTGDLTITCNDVKQFGATDNSVITVEYTARLNEKAVVGHVGNPNQVHLEFSNNPNPEGAGSVGNTPVDKVIVFTYEVVVNKVDEKNAPLTGAGFTLFKKDKNGEFQKIGDEVKGDGKTQFTWTGLDDGDYKLEETTTPNGYNTMEPIIFTITAVHDETSDNPALTQLTGTNDFNGNHTTGKLEATVVNHPGLVLPSTGGVGTTMFYVVGGILILMSGALLFVKKRKTSND